MWGSASLLVSLRLYLAPTFQAEMVAGVEKNVLLTGKTKVGIWETIQSLSYASYGSVETRAAAEDMKRVGFYRQSEC